MKVYVQKGLFFCIKNLHKELFKYTSEKGDRYRRKTRRKR